ncbi:3'-5' exonuclease [Candidatus Woesearchaeota archaeon]|nr:3'-5' exonuclease [Candidatus Woesearchaeota archaeon]
MIIVDVETTGLDPKKHSIVSIGAIDFYNTENQFYEECRIFDGAEISQEALAINGFTEEQIKDHNKRPLREVVKYFFIWTARFNHKTIAGQNPAFDRDFLRATAERYNLFWPLHYRTVDLHSLCYAHYLKRGLFPPIKDGTNILSPNQIYAYVGMPEENLPHNGLFGAKMEAEAFSRLIHGKNLLREFSQYPIPEYLIQK